MIDPTEPLTPLPLDIARRRVMETRRERRNARIVQAFHAGQSRIGIAKAEYLSRQQVYAIAGRNRSRRANTITYRRRTS